MNREQMKHLKEHVGNLRRKKYDATNQPPSFPSSIAAAKRTVEAWGAAQRRIRDGRHARLEKAYSTVWQAILFQDAPTALKALREFEKFQP